ncbi:MAG: NHL repeat-containing protein, partial [Chloroflexales bacterium]
MQPAPFPVQRRLSSVASTLMLFALCLTLFSPFGVPQARALTSGQAAILVLGQPTFSSMTIQPNRTRLPSGVAVDSTTGKIFVADGARNRVLRFASAANLSDGTNAEGVFGQADFISNGANRGGTTPNANTLSQPMGIAVDSSGNLWVADYYNNRVLLVKSAGSRTSGDLGNADSVIGQPDFISGASNRSGSSTPVGDTLYSPMDVTVDSSNTLWVADSANNRVLGFAGATGRTGTDLGSADVVLGQPDFASASPNRGGLAGANTLSKPSGVAEDG